MKSVFEAETQAFGLGLEQVHLAMTIMIVTVGLVRVC